MVDVRGLGFMPHGFYWLFSELWAPFGSELYYGTEDALFRGAKMRP